MDGRELQHYVAQIDCESYGESEAANGVLRHWTSSLSPPSRGARSDIGPRSSLFPVTLVASVGAMATSLWAREGFVEGFTKSALMILVSEIGDKTFFIAAVMAMRHPHLPVRSTRTCSRVPSSRASAPFVCLTSMLCPPPRCFWAHWARCG